MPPTGVQQKTYCGTARSQARSATYSVLATDRACRKRTQLRIWTTLDYLNKHQPKRTNTCTAKICSLTETNVYVDLPDIAARKTGAFLAATEQTSHPIGPLAGLSVSSSGIRGGKT